MDHLRVHSSLLLGAAGLLRGLEATTHWTALGPAAIVAVLGERTRARLAAGG